MKSADPAFHKALHLTGLFIKIFRFYLFSLAVGVLGAILCVTPLGLYLEEEFGLDWLFLARGETTPPKDVVIVSVDQTTSDLLKLPDNPQQWPRDYYAQLIDKINQQQPALIAMNIVFGEKRDEAIDQQLAHAIASHDNVILSNYLKHKTVPMADGTAPIIYETLVESIDSITAAALSAGPFVIPKAASTVKQFWLNKDSAGDVQTFPYIVFQCYVFKEAYPQIIALLNTIAPALAAKMPASFAQFAQQHNVLGGIEQIQTVLAEHAASPEQQQQLFSLAHTPARQQQLITAWLKVAGSKSLYLNHYGNVGAITTIPFYQALNGLPNDTLKDKIVMIGFSESIEPEKTQGYYTVYSNANDQTTSPIDLAATAIGNLIDDTWLKPLELLYQFLILLGWGAALSILSLTCPYRVAASTIVALSAAYAYLAYYEFASTHIWLPSFIPLALQMPLILSLVSIMHFRSTDRAKTKMQRALNNLLPKEVVDNIPRQPENWTLNNSGTLLQGVCMATDVRDYTRLSESLKPSALINLMNDYYATVFPAVNQHGGFITDLAGDGMYAVWDHPEDNRQSRINACRAALAIKDRLRDFNQNRPQPLITRFGVSCGDISIGHTGAPGRYIYRAIGDPVNTASRIEGLNKHLGTQILVNAAVIDGLEDFFLRDMGWFILKGKAKPVHIFELMDTHAQTEGPTRTLANAFADALALFQNQQPDAALAAFLQLNQHYPDDGPSRFFTRYLQNTAQAPENPSNDQLPKLIDITAINF